MTINIKVLIGQIVMLFLIFALLLFLPAGTIAWPAGWIFMALFFSFVIAISLWLLGYNPGLLKERMAVSKPDQKTWDKLLFALIQAFFIAWFIIMPLDAVRFHWSQMPIWLQVVGAIILLCSFYLFYLVFRENLYLSPLVRIQEDRGQTVVSTGPYYYIRHPMYAAFLPFMLGTALLLGSWYGLLVGLLLVGTVARRAVLEERTLQEELQGYSDYMNQVKYRFIPYIW